MRNVNFRQSLTLLSCLLPALVGACAASTLPEANLVAQADSPSASGDPLACAALPNTHPLAATGSDLEIRPLRFVDLPGVPEMIEPDVERVVGVRMRFAAQPGMTDQWLLRQVHCYRRSSPDNGTDPLLVSGAHIDVSSHGGRFTIDISSEQRQVAEDIQRGAQAFLAERGTQAFVAASP